MNIDNLRKKIEDHPLSTIDDIINFATEESPEKIRAVLPIFVDAIIEYKKIEANTNSIDEIFRADLGFSNQQFIAACILRLIAANDSILNTEECRKTLNLFDKVFENDLYKRNAINAKDMSFDKESKLKSLLNKAENDWDESVNINDLNTLPHFKQRYYRFTGRNSTTLISPFLCTSLIGKAILDEVFSAIETYQTSEENEKINAYNKAHIVINDYVSQADNYGTVYSRKYLAEPFKKILQWITEDFKRLPISKPANLTISQTEKKYPFLQTGAKFKISFIIQNKGEGHVLKAEAKILEHSNEVEFVEKSQILGTLSKNRMFVDFECVVLKPTDIILVSVEIRWKNYDYTGGEEANLFELYAQHTGIDWERLKYEDPYSWEPVETEDKLIGRKEILNSLLAGIIRTDQRVSSYYLHGQKRVGKTSIAKTLRSRILNQAPNNFIVIYLESGDYADPSPTKTIEKLGLRLCTKIIDSDVRFRSLEIPKFDGALSPLSLFLDRIETIAPQCKILMILDEFDEISTELYKRGAIGDSFFLTVRAISNKPQFGFLLVGGEKIDFIINCQGEQLNKFQSQRVDYFDKEKYWSDFKELVRKPIDGILEITEKAIECLYNQTTGNPFFTNIICSALFKLMVDRRDNHVTELEMLEAVKKEIFHTGIQIFSHFWEDGIKEKGDKEEEISIQRRQVLLSVGKVLSNYKTAKKELIISDALNSGLDETKSVRILKEFEERQILINNHDIYHFKVNFFSDWLIESGIDRIIMTFADAERIKQHQKRQEEARIKAEEVLELTRKWGGYDGQEITTDKVRLWLEQFGEPTKQRLMFKILQSIRFYSDYNIKIAVREIFHQISEKTRLKSTTKGKILNLLVSYLDGIGKSGAEYAKIFSDQNDIHPGNVVEKDKILPAIQTKKISGLIFVDDFIGTGNTAVEYLEAMIKDYPQIFQDNIRIYFTAICGFQEAKLNIENKCQELGIPITICLHDILGANDKCFSESSDVFPNPSDRMMAKDICYEHGINLVTRNPLGYGECQASVVFSKTCPNNSLPILWAKSETWTPLFERKI